MRRWAFNVTTALSLLLCTATLVLWARSYWTADEFVTTSGNWSSTAGWTDGVFFLHRIGPIPSRPGEQPLQVVSVRAGHVAAPASSLRHGRRMFGDPGIRHEGGAFGFYWFASDGGIAPVPGAFYAAARFPPMRQYIVPCWPAAMLFAAMPVAWTAATYRARRRRLRVVQGRCVRCGYDVRATPGRCPECGAIPAMEVKAEQPRS